LAILCLVSKATTFSLCRWNGYSRISDAQLREWLARRQTYIHQHKAPHGFLSQRDVLCKANSTSQPFQTSRQRFASVVHSQTPTATAVQPLSFGGTLCSRILRRALLKCAYPRHLRRAPHAGGSCRVVSARSRPYRGKNSRVIGVSFTTRRDLAVGAKRKNFSADFDCFLSRNFWPLKKTVRRRR